MSDVRGAYAAIGVHLPPGDGPDVDVCCFANPEAHRNGDRNKSCSVALVAKSSCSAGTYNCGGCGASGSFWYAATQLGRTPKEAAKLCEDYGLPVPSRGQSNGAKRANGTKPRPVAPAPAPAKPPATDEEVAGYVSALRESPARVAALAALRRWSPAAICALELGYDEGRGRRDGRPLVFIERRGDGALSSVVRFQPDKSKVTQAAGGLKTKAIGPREIFPRPEGVPGRDLYVGEGPGVAVALRTLELPAVAFPSSKPRRSAYGTWLKRLAEGRERVYLLPDCDEEREDGSRPGYDLMAGIAADLAPLGPEVRIIDLADLAAKAPEHLRNGFDVDDALHLAVEAHGEVEGVEKLRNLLLDRTESTPPFEPDPAPAPTPWERGNVGTLRAVPAETGAVEPNPAESSVPTSVPTIVPTPAADPWWERCDSVLDEFEGELEAAGLVGEVRAAKLLYLVATTRLFPKPVSAVLKGPSSGGKSHTTGTVLKFLPDAAFHAYTGGSEKSLIYDPTPLVHRMLVLYEAPPSNELYDQLMRTLLSEGRIRWLTVDYARKGDDKSLCVEREGPTGLLETTTQAFLDPELETRMLSVPITDTPEQTRKVLRAIAVEEGGYGPTPPNYARWHAFQTWLEEGEREVVVPFLETVVRLMPTDALREERLKRDFSKLAQLVKAHALMHRTHRARDERGRIVAEVADYEAVHPLVADLLSAAAGASVPERVRQVVEAVAALSDRHPDGVQGKHIMDHTGLSKSSVNRTQRLAVRLDYLRNEETRPRQPAKLKVGTPLPGDVSVLPEPDAVAAALAGDEPPPTFEPLPEASPEEEAEYERLTREFGEAA